MENPIKNNTSKGVKILKFVGIVLLCVVLVGAIIVCVPIISARVSNADEVDKGAIVSDYVSDGKAFVVANRGGSYIVPENTMLAVKQCANSAGFKVDIFKLDVRITSDDKLILLNDETFDRTSNSPELFGTKSVKVADKTYEELSGLNLGEKFIDKDANTVYAGLRDEKIPSDLRVTLLDDVFDYLTQQGDYKFIVQIKDSGENGKKVVDILYNIIESKGLIDSVIASVESNELATYIDENYEKMLRSATDSEEMRLYFASGFGVDIKQDEISYEILQVPTSKLKFIQFDNKRFLNYARRHNVAVMYEDINDHKDMVELNNMGADAIITDEPDALYRIVNKKSIDNTEFVTD